MEITLTRQKKISNLKSQILNRAIHGTLSLPFDPNSPLTYETLENADYLIPAGTYPLKRTYSPKFKKLIPLIDEVPNRTGIRIHMGTKPEHSTGCVLTTFAGMAYLDTLFNRLEKYYENEKVTITITDDFDADSRDRL